MFLLYSQLQSSDGKPQTEIDLKSSGLGSVDSNKGELVLEIDYTPSATTSPEVSIPIPMMSTSPPSSSHAKRRKSSESSKKRRKDMSNKSLELTLFQDTTGLRSRKGDTGKSTLVPFVIK